MSDVNRIDRLSDLERAMDHPDDQARLQVLQLISKNPQRALALRQGERDVIDALEDRVVREPSSPLRVAMLTALASLGNDPRIIARMVSEAQESHGTFEHMLSLSYLAQHDSQRAGPFARRLLFSAHRDQVRIATKLLGDEHDFTPAERVRVLVVEPRRSNRAWNDTHLSALLRELAGDFRAGAREVVEVHHPELLGELVARWDNLDIDTQGWLVESCDAFPPSPSIATLLTSAIQASDDNLVGLALHKAARLGLDNLGMDERVVRPFMQAEDRLRVHAIAAAASADEALAILTEGASDAVMSAALQRLARLDPDRPTVTECQAWLEHLGWRVRAAAATLLALRSDLDAWLSERWSSLSERARVAVARAALEQNRDRELEARLAGAWSP